MNPSVGQIAIPTSNTTFDCTDSVISSDWKGGIYFGTTASANNTQTAEAAFFIGGTDGTRNAVYCCSIADATAGGRSRQYISTTECIARVVASSGTVNVKGAYSATLSNGSRLSLSANSGVAHLCNYYQMSGTGFEFGIGTATYSTSDTVKSITHNLTGAIDGGILVIANGIASFGSSSELRYTLGFFDGTNAAGHALNYTTLSNPSTIAARLVADVGHQIVGLADNATWSLGANTASTIDLTRTAAGGSSACAILFAWRATTGVSGGAAQVSTMPTSTGNAALFTGLSVKPQVLFSIPSRLTATTLQTDDTTGCFGLGIACNNNGSTQQASAIAVAQDAAATSVGKSFTDNTLAGSTSSSAGSVVRKFTVNSWDAAGVTPNHSVVTASAEEIAAYAYGTGTTGSGGPLRSSIHGGFAELTGGFRG